MSKQFKNPFNCRLSEITIFEMAISKSIREKVYNKYKGCCAYCGRNIEYKQMQIDHYYPQSRAKYYLRRHKIDVHAEANLMPTCRRCNHYKRAAHPEQFRKLMKTLHERLESIYILKVAVDFGMATVKPFDGKFYFEKLPALMPEQQTP